MPQRHGKHKKRFCSTVLGDWFPGSPIQQLVRGFPLEPCGGVIYVICLIIYSVSAQSTFIIFIIIITIIIISSSRGSSITIMLYQPDLLTLAPISTSRRQSLDVLRRRGQRLPGPIAALDPPRCSPPRRVAAPNFSESALTEGPGPKASRGTASPEARPAPKRGCCGPTWVRTPKTIGWLRASELPTSAAPRSKKEQRKAFLAKRAAFGRDINHAAHRFFVACFSGQKAQSHGHGCEHPFFQQNGHHWSSFRGLCMPMPSTSMWLWVRV